MRAYHGTTTAVVGVNEFRLLPPESTGRLQEVGRKVRLDKVFATPDEGLPGRPVPMRNGRVVKLSLDGRQLFMETAPIWS